MEQPVNKTQRLLDTLSEMMQQEEMKQKMVEQTSSSLDVPAGVTQEEGRIGFFIHLLSAIGCSLRLIVGRDECLVVDARHMSGATTHRDDKDTKVDATLEISEDAFDLVCAGRLTPAHAFMTGRLKVTGNMKRAMKSSALFKLLREARPSEHRLESRL